ncbi:dual OB domain-containing protein [Rhodopseudomonas telluris]|uniref:Dual OB-containing domain-containing protein n=1 Tax=Rhodopseudomonas telluris TaxID=644215 RepID=A0ABV6EX11_9BRAD
MPRPNYSKTILCLANSRRPGGACFAGKELEVGKLGHWVRPIDAKRSNAIAERDAKYADGVSADLLDIVRMPMSAAAPSDHQTENHQIDPGFYWTKKGRATWEQIIEATDKVAGPLWSDGDHSFHGLNDKVNEETAKTLDGSLLLIKPSQLELVVGEESKFGGGTARKVRAKFKLNGTDYNFVVTDPWIETKYLAKPDGSYAVDGSRLCVSLAEILNGSATKLVAAVITPDRI